MNKLKQIPINPKYPYLIVKEVGSSYNHNITHEPANSLADAYRRMDETKDLRMCLICKVEERWKVKES